ncbi:MAG: lipoprotein [Chitinophagales bacterium]
MKNKRIIFFTSILLFLTACNRNLSIDNPFNGERTSAFAKNRTKAIEAEIEGIVE